MLALGLARSRLVGAKRDRQRQRGIYAVEHKIAALLFTRQSGPYTDGERAGPCVADIVIGRADR